MTNYIHHTSNTIDRAAGPLPVVWQNTSGLNLLSDAELKPLGWLPVTYVNSGYAAAFRNLSGVGVGDSVTPDADSVTGTYSYKSLADCKAAKLAQLAAYRYEQEVGGITVSSVPVATDRQSQSLMTAARIIAKEDANYTVNWKGESGFVTLNAAAIIAIADAVRGHVQDCFDNEKTHTDAIDALTTAAEVAAYDFTTGW